MSSSNEGPPPTAEQEYAQRLERLQNKKWKKLLDVQRPYRWNLRRLNLGRVLDVGCGRGRTLVTLPAGSVGVDHNPDSIRMAREQGCTAYTVDEFFADPVASKSGSYDSMLAAHLIEHLTKDEAREVLSSYLPMIKPGGKIVFITPQERGYASDPTHVVFTDHAALAALSTDLGLTTVKQYSFPFPRWAGKLFIYNEFNHLARVPTGI